MGFCISPQTTKKPLPLLGLGNKEAFMSVANNIYIDGAFICSEYDFHKAMSSVLDFGSYYGYNLDALWDMLSSGAAGGVVLHWKDADISRKKMGPVFDTIIRLFNETKATDEKLGLSERFDFVLE